MTDQLHPMTPHDLPFYIVRPGETDVLMIAMGIFLIVAVLAVGNLYLHLHSLPERMAHKSQKLQFEVVAVLGLLALFTHIHLLWIAALLLALIDLPDFGTPLRSIAGSVKRIAGGSDEVVLDDERLKEAIPAHPVVPEKSEPIAAKEPRTPKREVPTHA